MDVIKTPFLIITLYLLSSGNSVVYPFFTDRTKLTQSSIKRKVISKKPSIKQYIYKIYITKKFRKNRKIWNTYNGTNWSMSVNINKLSHPSAIGKMGNEKMVIRNSKLFFISQIHTGPKSTVKVHAADFIKINKRYILNPTSIVDNKMNTSMGLSSQLKILADKLIKPFEVEVTDSSCKPKGKTITCNHKLTLITEENIFSNNKIISFTAH